MRASRLLSIQLMLETRGPMSARALAEAMGTSVRTLHRDVDQLTAAGVPIYAEKGRLGGFRLLAGWKARLTGLTSGEAQAVFLSGLGDAARDLGLADSVQAAQLKLLSAMPESWRGEAQKVQARFHLDPVDWYRESEPVPHLLAVAEGVWHERQLRVRYASWKREVDATLNPVGLVLKAGAWYLVAAAATEARTYRVSSFSAVTPLESPARRPARFDLVKYWAASVRRFEQELYAAHADVVATERGLARLRFQNAATARAVDDSTHKPVESGKVRLRIPIESIEHAAGHLLRLCPDVEVVGPAALRQAITERVRVAREVYEG